jgi:hypothetical protein
VPAEFDHPVAIEARAAIRDKINDREFYKALIAEKERGQSGPRSQEWARLHSVGYPSAAGVASDQDVARQQDARAAEQWDSYIANIKQHYAITPAGEAELRAGRINEETHKWAIEEKGRLVRDKGFYRKLLDGDRAAARDWKIIQLMLSLRPVKDYRPPSA